ncbi:PaaI family thioesterase [Saccharopolyspora spinosa]|uniref:Acyl-coenzyme A thioesterase THEM4 n=1 Tax=Saccharopolyspora spinosa TaxID=60894 RepID=A0A2N3Y4B5_SACSN|nr:PaaI family thioesterase [Saccharopolyspora spinosa]PKW17747.1 thioesterase superfamily protein [Saccharopolyspora spinosa]
MSALSYDAESDLRDRRRAVRELGAALRELTEAAVSTEVDAETLVEAAEQVRGLVPALSSARRERGQPPTVDDCEQPRRLYNPAAGPGNPIAPPMRVEIVDGIAIGTCTLGLAYEGPPSYVHGGISAMLLDQILGHAHAAANGKPGMTVKLSLRYRRPVPLTTPLRIVGRVVRRDGRCTYPVGTISTADDPNTVLVEAEGAFMVPNAEQNKRLFGELERIV